MWNLLLIGDSNLFHEVVHSSWLMSFFTTTNQSVASIIQSYFPDPVVPKRLRPPCNPLPLLEKIRQPDVYPLYSTRVGHADRTRLKSIMHLMHQIEESSVALVWIGQSDTWHVASDMTLTTEQKIDKIKKLAINFAELLNSLDFLFVVFVNYHDCSELVKGDVYQELNAVMIMTLMESTKYCKLIPPPTVLDSEFVDSTHVNATAKARIASHVLEHLWNIISDDLLLRQPSSSSDPWSS